MINLSIPSNPVRTGIVGAIILNTLCAVLGAHNHAPRVITRRKLPCSGVCARSYCNFAVPYVAAAWRRARVHSSTSLSVWSPSHFSLIGRARPPLPPGSSAHLRPPCCSMIHSPPLPSLGLTYGFCGQCYACFRRRTSRLSCCAEKSLGKHMCPIPRSVC